MSGYRENYDPMCLFWFVYMPPPPIVINYCEVHTVLRPPFPPKVALSTVAWAWSDAFWAADADHGRMMVRSLLGSADSTSADSAREAHDCEDSVSDDCVRRYYNNV